MTFQRQKMLRPEHPEVPMLTEILRLMTEGETEAVRQLCMRRLVEIESLSKLVDHDPALA